MSRSSSPHDACDAPTARPLATILIWILLAALASAGFVALGVWQLERRAWKLELIARVTQRAHAPPTPAPGPAAWPTLTANNAEYRHVRVTGRFIEGHDILVKAVTALGSGYWILTPLRTTDGFIVLINRGFVPPEQRDPQHRAAADTAHEVTPTGLLRITEPKGAFLHRNDPQAERWYSRDIAAITAARGLPGDRTAPYFIDADVSTGTATDSAPIGGLTVVSFHNDHLSYAFTWFVLALMPLAFILITIRRERRLRHPPSDSPSTVLKT